MKFVINKKSTLIVVSILILIFECALLDTVPFIKYFDELFTIVAAMYLLLQAIVNRHNKNNEISTVFIILGVICLLGMLGNIINKVTNSYAGIIIDWIGIVKIFVAFAFSYYLLSSNAANRTVKFLSALSKAYLIVATIFGILSLFINLNMGGEARYGIKSFEFVFHHAHIFSIICICALTYIIASETRDYIINFYTLLTCICQLLTTKGPSIIWTIIIWLMFRYYIHHRKVKPWLIVVLLIITVLLGQYQIRSYFLISTAPRIILLRYGIKTANRYFPLGSGFATYGGEMAKRNYSQLYLQYGFNTHWGMTVDDGRYLNDNYWPMIIGQFGYIGGLLFVVIFVKLFLFIQSNCNDRRVKALLISNFFYMILLSLGSAYLTGMEGVLLFLMFGTILALYKK